MFIKNNFQFFLLFAIEMAVLSVFLQKKGHGPLGVKRLQNQKSGSLSACTLEQPLIPDSLLNFSIQYFS